MKEKSIEELKRRRFDEVMVVIYALKTEVKVKKEEEIINSSMYSLIGINKIGKRIYIDTYLDDKDNHRYWLDVFEKLKQRGLKDILFFCSDDNNYMKKCIKVAYNQVIQIPLLLDIVDCFYQYFSDKFSSKIRTEIKELYTRNTLEEYKNSYLLFESKYHSNGIIKALSNKYLNNINKYYIYDVNIRKVLFNNYMLKTLKSRIDKVHSEYGFITEVNDILELIIGKINEIERFSSYTKKEWMTILDSVYQLFSEKLGEIL